MFKKIWLMIGMAALLSSAVSAEGDLKWAVMLSDYDNRASSHVMKIDAAEYILEAEKIEIASWISTKQGNSMEVDETLFSWDGEALRSNSVKTNTHSHISSLSLESFEYVVRIFIPNDFTGAGITFHSNYPASDTYYRIRGYPGGTFGIEPHPDETRGDHDFGIAIPVCSGVSVLQGTFWVRAQVLVLEGKTQIRAKIWEESKKEPGNWQIDVFDTSETRLREGKFGVWVGEKEGKGEDVIFDNFSIKKFEITERGIKGLDYFGFSMEPEQKTYQVAVKSTDMYGIESEWSDPYLFTPDIQTIVYEIDRPMILKIIIK